MRIYRYVHLFYTVELHVLVKIQLIAGFCQKGKLWCLIFVNSKQVAPLAKMSGAHQINGTHHLPPVSGRKVGKGTCRCASVFKSFVYIYLIWLQLLFLDFILLAHHLVRLGHGEIGLLAICHWVLFYILPEWCFRISWAQYSTWVRFPQEQFSAACQNALCIYRPAILSTSCVCRAQLVITSPCLPVLAPTNLQVWWSSLILFFWEGLWAKFSRVGFAI